MLAVAQEKNGLPIHNSFVSWSERHIGVVTQVETFDGPAGCSCLDEVGGVDEAVAGQVELEQGAVVLEDVGEGACEDKVVAGEDEAAQDVVVLEGEEVVVFSQAVVGEGELLEGAEAAAEEGGVLDGVARQVQHPQVEAEVEPVLAEVEGRPGREE
jgi:hypothetical protein